MEKKFSLGLVALFAAGVGGGQYFAQEGEPSVVSLPGAATPGGVEPLLTLAPELRRPLDTDLLTGLERIDLYQVGNEQQADQALVDDPEVLDEIQGFMEVYQGQYTIVRLQLLADELADIYRGRGLTLASVTLPAQDLLNPRVTLNLVPGPLAPVVAAAPQVPQTEQLLPSVTQVLSMLPADTTAALALPSDAQIPARVLLPPAPPLPTSRRAMIPEQGFAMPVSRGAVPGAATPGGVQPDLRTSVASSRNAAEQRLSTLDQVLSEPLSNTPVQSTPPPSTVLPSTALQNSLSENTASLNQSSSLATAANQGLPASGVQGAAASLAALQASAGASAVVTSVVAGAVAGVAASAVAALPDAATPGGVQPGSLKSPQKPAAEPPLNIPAKPSRPFDSDAGPQISLEQIELYQIGAVPEGGKTRVDDAEVLAQIQQFMAAYQGQYTIGRLQQLADELTRIYRGRGLILATVYLPAQDVLNQRVELNLLPGRLAKVVPEGQQSYDAEQLGRPFSEVLNKPLLKEGVESALLSLLSYPGLQVTGMLEPGEQLGTASLVLNVAQEDPVEGVVYADNYGSRFTGEERLGLGLGINNPFGLVDRLQLDLLVQNKPQDDGSRSVEHTLYGGIGYSFRPVDPRYTVGVNLSHNQYDVGRDLASFQFDGVTDQIRLHVKKQLVRSRTRNLFVETALASKTAVSERADLEESRDELTNLELAFGFDLFDRFLLGGYSEGQLRWVHGIEDFLGSMGKDDPNASRSSTVEGKADGGFDKLEFNLQRHQNLSAGNALMFRFNSQYSNDPLVSLEQFGLGGVASVRAYSGAEYMADKGFYAGLELRSNAPGFADRASFNGRTWGQSLQLSVFADYARGYKNDALGNEIEQIALSGAGVGLRLMPSNSLSLNATLATPLGSVKPSSGRDPQFFVDISYSF